MSCRAIGAASRCSGRSRIFAIARSNGARLMSSGARRSAAWTTATNAHRRRSAAHWRAHSARRADRCRSQAPAHGTAWPRRSPARRSRCRDRGCDGGAGAARQHVERQEAAAGGAVMAGTERGRGFDLDTDAMDGHARAIVRAMHDEAAGGDRLETREAFLHPVAWRDAFDDDGARRSSRRRRARSSRAVRPSPGSAGNE